MGREEGEVTPELGRLKEKRFVLTTLLRIPYILTKMIGWFIPIVVRVIGGNPEGEGVSPIPRVSRQERELLC